MTVVRNQTGLAGPQLVKTFLSELTGYVLGTPDGFVDGTPQEIVENVVSQSDKFASCSDSSVNNLAHQVAMSVRAQGAQYGLVYERLSNDGRIKVAVV